MRRFVIIHNEVVGFHRYPNAPAFCKYLEARHRHVFVIECQFEVSHNEREIEINEMQERLRKELQNDFGYPCEFGDMSCESIAEHIIMKFPYCSSVKVLEDGYGGASLTR